VVVVVVLVIFTSPPPVARAQYQTATLYQRLGGREGIALVVDEFVAFLVADARVNERFTALKPADVARLKSHAADQVCEATGGPCAYVGRDMKTAHTGMNITEDEWNAAVEDLVRALDKRGVGEPEKQELLDLLGPMKPDIVAQ
jgi:hemoglobin